MEIKRTLQRYDDFPACVMCKEPQCVATVEKAIKEGRQWAEVVFKEGDRTVGTFVARVASQ